MRLLGTSKLSKGAKTTIIKSVLEKLDLKEGDLIVYYENEEEIVIRKA
ncbi:MAG: hypothetical protein R6U44_12315 [Archaeoglobaceae archaeon]